MGKQVGFYMTYEDERAFLETVQRERGPIVVTSDASKEKLEVIEELMPVKPFDTRVLIVRAADLEDVVSKYIPTQGYYSVDIQDSPVIEFGRCEMRPNRCETKPGWLASGRLWFDEWTMAGRKNEDFCDWANKLFAWFRRHYKRTDDRNNFVGPEATDLSTRGLLQLGGPMERIPDEEIKRILGLE